MQPLTSSAILAFFTNNPFAFGELTQTIFFLIDLMHIRVI